MEPITPRFDNLQNELRRELDPRGFLEEEVFRSVVKAAVNRRLEAYSAHHYYKHDRAFFLALRELRALQAQRRPRPLPPAKPARTATVIVFPPALAA
jgi:hypothetical protein